MNATAALAVEPDKASRLSSVVESASSARTVSLIRRNVAPVHLLNCGAEFAHGFLIAVLLLAHGRLKISVTINHRSDFDQILNLEQTVAAVQVSLLQMFQSVIFNGLVADFQDVGDFFGGAVGGNQASKILRSAADSSSAAVFDQ